MPWYGDWLKFVVAWYAAGFGALLLLRQSMARAKVKVRHVLRAFAYVTLPFAAGHALYCAATFALDAVVLYRPNMVAGPMGDLLPVAFILAMWVWVIVSLSLAYSRYLHIKHAWVVAVATQLIAVFFAATIMVIDVWFRYQW